MQPEFRVVAWCANTHDLLVETPDAFLMVDIAGYLDAEGKTVMPELAEQKATTVVFNLQQQEWTVPLAANLGATMLRPDHRAGTEKAVLQ